MATAIVLILVLAVEHYLSNQPLVVKINKFRSNTWLSGYSRFMQINVVRKLHVHSVMLVSLILLLPLLLLFALCFWLSCAIAGGAGYLLFSTLAFYYCLVSDGGRKFDTLLVQYHELYFAIIFWFALLGPIGAFIYWLLLNARDQFIASSQEQKLVVELIKKLHALVAWIPARITGLVYALVGNFAAGFNSWLNCLIKPNMQISNLLDECGQAALVGQIANNNDAESCVKLLTFRALVAWLVLAVVLSLIQIY